MHAIDLDFAKNSAKWLGCCAVALAVTLSSSPAPAASPQDEAAMTVTLLGTGTPVPLEDRFGPATLVEAGDLKMLFDAGRGAPIRINQAGLALGEIDAVFLTHLHSDHFNGLPDVWMTSYIPVGFGNRSEPLVVIGPTGTSDMVDGMRDMAAEDIRIRQADEKVAEVASQVEATDIDGEGVVFDQHGVTVTAFNVNHGELIKPSLGYRIDYQGKSVLISGDTKYDPNVIEHGQGVDLLIHEVMAVPDALKELPNIRQVIHHHTSPVEAGRVFAQTQPRMAAYTHFVLLGTAEHPPLDADDVERQTRETYDGPLTMGEDLMKFYIGDEVMVESRGSGISHR